MALKTYDTKEAIPSDALRAAAIETKEGKFVVEEVDEALRDSGKAALQAERDRADAADKARKLAEKKAADLEREREARAKGVTEEELQRIRDAEAAARQPIEAELAATKAENRRLKLTDRVHALALTHGIMPDRLDDAMLVLDKRTDLGDAGGIVFKDKDGKTVADDAKAFFDKLKTEKPWFFKGSGASGSGASGSNGDGDTTAPSTPEAIAATKRRQVSGAF